MIESEATATDTGLNVVPSLDKSDISVDDTRVLSIVGDSDDTATWWSAKCPSELPSGDNVVITLVLDDVEPTFI